MTIEYRMTRRVTTANGKANKLNLDGTFPFKPGDLVRLVLEDVETGRVWEGVRKVRQSGTSRAVGVPASSMMKAGDLVHAKVSAADEADMEEEDDGDARVEAEEGHQGVPQQQEHILGDSPRGVLRQVRGPRPHRLLQGDVRRPRGQDLRGQAERDPEGPPEGDRGVGGRLRHSAQRQGRRGGPRHGGTQI